MKITFIYSVVSPSQAEPRRLPSKAQNGLFAFNWTPPHQGHYSFWVSWSGEGFSPVEERYELIVEPARPALRLEVSPSTADIGRGEEFTITVSTDLYASSETAALEVLPLPSEPSVAKASFESFEAIQRLMLRSAPKWIEKLGLEVVFHEKIGAHDVVVVRAS